MKSIDPFEIRLKQLPLSDEEKVEWRRKAQALPMSSGEEVKVTEVDAQGRVLRGSSWNRNDRSVGVIEYQNGYRPLSGVQHEYDPLTRGLGKGNADERS